MRLLLLQDQVYLPSLGGGNKAGRLLLESLSRRGHACAAVAPCFTGRAGPADDEAVRREAAQRAIPLELAEAGRYRFRHRGILVDTIDFGESERARALVRRRLADFAPDCVLVTDDKPRFLLEVAMDLMPDRAVHLLQTVVHLPFGPCAARPCTKRTALVRSSRKRLVISRFLQRYVEQHGQMTAEVVRMPVFGEGPFAVRGVFGKGPVTLINPCVEKGLPIFLALARRFPDVAFCGVPTWGGAPEVLSALASLPNVRVRPPDDDIDVVLAGTRVLLVPSLWPETFGYVVVDAMLRGIPVLASDIGGLAEAKLGVEFLLPVAPAVRHGGEFISPGQDIEPWVDALGLLLTDERRYRACATASRKAAHAFVREADGSGIERALSAVAAGR